MIPILPSQPHRESSDGGFESGDHMPMSDNEIRSAVEAEAIATSAERDRFQSGRVLAVSAGHATHDTYTAFLPPLLPLFIANMSLSKVEAGLLSVFTQAPSLIQPVIGHMADHTERHRLVYLAPGVTAALMCFLGLVPDYLLLAVLLCFAGLSSAVFHAVGPVIAGTLSGRNLGKGMSYWMVGGELGRVLGPIIIVSAIRWITIRNIPWLMVFGFIVSLFLFIRLGDVRTHPHGSARAQDWRTAMKRIAPVIYPLSGFIFFRSFMYAAMTIFLPTLLTEDGTSLWLAGASLTILEAAGVAGALTGGSISDRLGRRIVLLTFTLVTPVFLCGFLFSGGWIRYFFMIFLGFGLMGTTPVIMALVQETYPENRALANGVYMSLSFVIRSLGVILVGMIGDALSLWHATIISGVSMVVAVPFILMLPRGNMDS